MPSIMNFLLFKIENIHVDIDVGFPPKEPQLIYNLVIKNKKENDITLDYLRLKIIVADLNFVYEEKDLLLKGSKRNIITIRKKLDLVDFGISTFSYYVKMEVYKYKIRGLCKYKEDIFRIRSQRNDKESSKEKSEY